MRFVRPNSFPFLIFGHPSFVQASLIPPGNPPGGVETTTRPPSFRTARKHPVYSSLEVNRGPTLTTWTPRSLIWGTTPQIRSSGDGSHSPASVLSSVMRSPAHLRSCRRAHTRPLGSCAWARLERSRKRVQLTHCFSPVDDFVQASQHWSANFTTMTCDGALRCRFFQALAPEQFNLMRTTVPGSQVKRARPQQDLAGSPSANWSSVPEVTWCEACLGHTSASDPYREYTFPNGSRS